MKTDYVSLETNVETGLMAMARTVYAHLEDEISRKIFQARCLYAFTGNTGAMTGLDMRYRNLSSDIEIYASKIKKGDHCLIHGTGVGAHYLASRFRYFGVKVDAFIDTDESKGEFDEATGIPIIQEKDLIEKGMYDRSRTIVISYSNKMIARETFARLCIGLGISDQNIAMGLYDWRNNASQYFDFFDPKEHEVFVDCGCYDGGSCYRFVGWCGVKGYDQIYSFEADPANYQQCKTLLEPLGKCTLFPYGTAQKHETVYFASKGFEDSCIISKQEAEGRQFDKVEMIETVALDEVLAGKRITFLKMDVEGAEYDALLGASQLIKENRPRMAISIYHRLEDFITIPALVLQMHPDYKIFFRHYGLDDLETIMYVE